MGFVFSRGCTYKWSIKTGGFVDQIPYLDLTIQKQALEPRLSEIVQKVMTHGQYILGPEVQECEHKLAEFTGAPFCVSAASGTDALLLALLAHGIQPGDEIIVPAFSFFATAEVIALIGAVPVFADIDEETFNLDVTKVESLITEKTKGILPVSLYGQTADMDAINALAQSKGLVVMEDAAQSFGARYQGKTSCNLSSYACTSFFPAKPLGCMGDGGAVFCQTEEQAERLRQVRNHGQESRYYHTHLGYNGRLDTLQCAILIVKLERYPWEIEQRQRIAHIYNEAFGSLESVKIPVVKEGRESVWAQYTLRVSDRDKVQARLMEEGVPTSVHYPKGMHQQPALKNFIPRQPLTVTETICEEVFSLPLYADMPEEHTQFVVDKVKKVLG
jgi:UDP-2-acetamido-2-deoxy-ribo-hexuluronate aminotransferase